MTLTRIATYSGLEFDVRPADVQDRARLDAFWPHISKDALARRSANPADAARANMTQTFLAFGGDAALIAVAVLTPDRAGDTADVQLFTDDRATYHGVSWAFLEHVLMCARDSDVKTVESTFSADDVRASRLDRKMGFVEVGQGGEGDVKTLRWTLTEPL